LDTKKGHATATTVSQKRHAAWMINISYVEVKRDVGTPNEGLKPEM
jgi:hypothetical protein